MSCGQLVAAERLLARVDRLVVAQHGDVHHVGADVDHRDVLVLAAAGQRPAPRVEARSAAAKDSTSITSGLEAGELRPPRRGPRPFPCARRRSALPAPRDWSAPGRGPGSRGSLPRARTGCTGWPRSRPGPRAPPRAAPAETMIFLVITAPVGTAMATFLVRVPRRLWARLTRVADRLEIVDVAVHHRVPGQRLDRVALDAVAAFARLDDLEHLHRGRADVQPEQRRRLGCEQVQCHLGFFTRVFPFAHRLLGAIRRNHVKC